MITDPKNIYFNRKTAKAATTKHLDRRRHWFLSSLAFLLYFVIVVVSTTTKTTYPLRRSSLSSNLGRILRTLPSKQGLVTTNRWYNHRQERRRVPQEQRDQQRVQHPRKSVHQDLLQINSDSTDPARTKIDSILDKYCNKGTRPLLRLRGGAGNDDGDNSGDINGTMAGKDTNQNAPANSTTTMDPAAVTTTATNTDTNTTEKSISTLSKIRQTLFPIESNEAKKFLLIGSIKFFIILALTLTRDTKDTLVVTQCGAEAIAFLKIYGVLPAATAFITLYSKMSNMLGKKSLFYCTCIPFFTFFALFDIFLYPNADKLHPSLSTIEALLPGDATTGGMGVLAKIIANWTSALFYIMAEIYSSASVGLLFWQYANDVVPIDQAKRFYPLFAQMSGLAPVLAGQYVVHFASKAANFGDSMHRLTAAVTVAGIMICFFYNASSSYIERTEGTSAPSSSADGASAAGKSKAKKKKPSMAESARFLASSQYLRLIAALVLGYGLSINFTEIMWKSLVKKQYPNKLDYQRFMGNFSSAVGLATCIVIFFGVHVIRILGWKVGALATPSIMSLLAAPFFACILLGLDSPTRLHGAVILGTIQNLLSKTSKYALFDPTTQMAYIPLDEESKVKGKAAIDVLGSRIGKSGGSLIQQGLIFIFGNIINAAPVVAMIYYAVLFGWIGAASKLSTLFVAQTELDKANKMESKEKKDL